MNLREDSIKKEIGMLLLIAVLGFTAYSFVLTAPFKTLDDQSSIVNNIHIRSFLNIGKIFQSGFFEDHTYWRPLVSLSFMAEYHFFGLNPFYYYLTNILLHLATGLIIFFLIKAMFHDRNTAFFVSLLFVVHPVHWDAVSNIAGRSIVLCGFFSISAFLLHYLYLQKSKGWVYYGGSLILFILALLCKESAAVFPLLILSARLILKPVPGGKFLSSLKEVLPFLFIDTLYCFLRYFFGITEIMKEVGVPRDVFLEMGTFFRATISYLGMLVVPTDFYYDRAAAVFQNYLDIELILTVLFFLALTALLLRIKDKLSPQARFFIAWFWIGLLPVSQIVPLKIQPGYIAAAEHFLYVSSVGIFVLAVLSVKSVYLKKIKAEIISPFVFKTCASGLYLYLLMVLIQHVIYSKDDLTMMERALQYNPSNVRVRNSVGYFYTRLLQFNKAEWHFRKVLEIDHRNITARISLGKVLCDQGRYFEGVNEYEKATIPYDEKFEKYKRLLEDNRRLAYEALIRQYKEQLVKKPEDPQLHFSLGVMYSKTGNIEGAIKEYELAVKADPRHRNALFNLASSYEAVGQLSRAAANYEKVIALERGDELAYYAYSRLGGIYRQSGDTEKSEKYLEENNEIREMFDQKSRKPARQNE